MSAVFGLPFYTRVERTVVIIQFNICSPLLPSWGFLIKVKLLKHSLSRLQRQATCMVSIYELKTVFFSTFSLQMGYHVVLKWTKICRSHLILCAQFSCNTKPQSNETVVNVNLILLCWVSITFDCRECQSHFLVAYIPKGFTWCILDSISHEYGSVLYVQMFRHKGKWLG